MQVAQAQKGWDGVKAAHVIGAADWCAENANENDMDKERYQSISQGASRILDNFIKTGEVTRGEALLIKQRNRDNGNYLGRTLNTTECFILKNTVANFNPWELVTSRQGRFAVEMPGQPSRQDTTNEIQGRKFNWIMYESSVEPKDNLLLEKGEYYLVAYTDLPPDYATKNSKDTIFDNLGRFIFKEMGLPELKNVEREVTLDGVTARLASGEGYTQSVATVMYIVDQRFYLNLIVSKDRSHFVRFIRSFEALDLTKKSANKLLED